MTQYAFWKNNTNNLTVAKEKEREVGGEKQTPRHRNANIADLQ